MLESINERLVFDKDEVCAGGEKEVEEVVRLSPIPLPQDYVDFLKEISGEDSDGVEFEIAMEEGSASIWLWSAQMAKEKFDEFNEPFNKDFMNQAWLIGCDLGDLVYCYGKGKDGFGIYRTEDGSLSFDDMTEKIADTLTDFLINGVGVDIAITL